MRLGRPETPIIERFCAKLRFPVGSDCIEWTAHVDCWGYGVIWDNDKKGNRHASNVAYELFVGEIPHGMVVMHTCDNPLCVNPLHLKLGTQGENMADMVRKGRSLRGERNHKAKLTIDQVNLIRKLFKSGNYTKACLSAMFKISDVQVSSIVSETSWKGIC